MMEDDVGAVMPIHLDSDSDVGAQVDMVFGTGLSAEQRASAVRQFEALRNGESGEGLDLLLGGASGASGHVIDESSAGDALQRVAKSSNRDARHDRRGRTIH